MSREYKHLLGHILAVLAIAGLFAFGVWKTDWLYTVCVFVGVGLGIAFIWLVVRLIMA